MNLAKCTFCLKPEALDRLRTLAALHERSVSQMCERAVRRLLAAEAKKSKRQTAEPSELQ